MQAVTEAGSKPIPALDGGDRLVRHQTQLAIVWRQLQRDRLALLGAAIAALLVLVAVLGEVLAPYDPATQFMDGLTPQGMPLPSTLPQSTRFILGTDASGRDLLSRLIFGTRVSLTVGVLANGLAVVLGLLIGGIGGYFRGWVGSVAMRITDMVMAFPSLLLAIALVAVLKPSLWVIVMVIGLVQWTWIGRVIYGDVLSLREREFVTAAVCSGVRHGRILFRHLLPHLIPTAIVWGTLGIATNVMLEASLSYLGIGIQPPTPSWGGMIQQGQYYYRSAPWLILFPGLAIMLSVLSFNLLGDGLRDALDPYQRK
jgi:peptide/nickel transport system permease protein